MTEDEMVGWHHQLDGREFEQTPEDCEAQGSLVCCSPWGCKESDTTERLNKNSFQRKEGSSTVYWCGIGLLAPQAPQRSTEQQPPP